MIIDCILDRLNCEPDNEFFHGYIAEFSPEHFKKSVLDYCDTFDWNYMRNAFTDTGDREENEYQVKAALCKYIAENEYNLNIIPALLKYNWT